MKPMDGSSSHPPSSYPNEVYTALFIVKGPLDPVLNAGVIGYNLYYTFSMNADQTFGRISNERVGGEFCNLTLNASIVKVPDTSFGLTCGDISIDFNASYVTWVISDAAVGGTTVRLPNDGSVLSTANFPPLNGKKYGRRFVTIKHSLFPGYPDWPHFIIEYYPAAPKLTVTKTDPACYGSPDGTITIGLSDIPPQVPSFLLSTKDAINNNSIDQNTYLISQFPKTIMGIPDGEYSIQIANMGAYGTCSTKHDPNVKLIQPSEVIIEDDNFTIQPSKCKDIGITGANINSGSITATASGGSGIGYTYFLDYSTTALPSNIATGLSKGSHTIKARDSKNCPSADYVKIVGEPATAMSVSLSATERLGYNISCNGASDGLITASPSLAIPGYTFEWYKQPDNTLISGESGQKLLGRFAGGYSVKLTDGNGCIARSTNITLSQPPALDFTIDPSGTLDCAGGKIGLTANATSAYLDVVNGQRLPLTYKWDLPGGETVASVVNKPAGDYGVTVTDKQGCNLYKTHKIVDPPGSTVTISPVTDFHGSVVSCNGKADGILSATVVGSASDYTWFRNGSPNGYGATMSSISNVNKGDYKVVITYNSKCKAEASFSVSEPESVDAAIVVTSSHHGQAISCTGASDANLKASVLNPNLQQSPYTYKWNTGIENPALLGVKAGNYSVVIKDVNNCEGSASIDVDDPAPVVALINTVSNYSNFGVSCFGRNDGNITAGGQGGTGVYSYSWSNGMSTSVNSNLTAGTYTVTVSDNNGCHDDVSQVITSPPLLELDFGSFNDVSCFGGNNGAIALEAKGGVVNTYEFSKDNGTSWQASPVFNGLAIGNYTLTVKDNNNCQQTLSKTLVQPNEIEIAFSDVNPSLCSTLVGTATANVTGGVSGYSYEWRDSESNAVGNNAATLSNVRGDEYTVTVHDSNLCEATNSVVINSLDGAKSNYTMTPAKCFDSSDGSALVNITSGDGPFDVEWPDGQTTLQGINLKRDAYNVRITDVRNCTVIQTVNVSSPDALQLQQQNKIIPTCNGDCDGTLELVASGGVGGYSYLWNGKTSSLQTQLCAGDYPVVLKDGNQCVLNQTITLEQPDPVDVIVLNESLPTCKDDCNGALEIAATGGNGGFAYTWAVGGNASIKNNLCPGEYTVSVIDAKGCSIQKNVILKNTPPIPINLGGGVTVCVGQSYSLDAGGNWSSMKWKSNTGFESTDQRVVIKEPGSYWLETTNDRGCIAQDTFLLETSTDLLKASFMIPAEAVMGDTVAIIDVSWPLPETIEWDYPLSMKVVRNLDDVIFGQFMNPGDYTINLTAHLGECLGQVSKVITILSEAKDEEGGRLGYEAYVKDFTLYPNPNDGLFDVNVELVEAGPISLSIWNSSRGTLIKQTSLQGESLYNLKFDLRPIASGAYVIRLDHVKGKSYLRFIIY